MMQIDPIGLHLQALGVSKKVYFGHKKCTYFGRKRCILFITNCELPDCNIVECESWKKRPGRYRNKGRTFGLESAERIFPEVLVSLYNYYYVLTPRG